MTTLAALKLTTAAVTAVVRLASEESVAAGAALALIRADRSSRAIHLWRHAGGSSQRRYLCTRTGSCIATESARYRRTGRAQKAIDAHVVAEESRVVADTDLLTDVEQAAAVAAVCTTFRVWRLREAAELKAAAALRDKATVASLAEAVQALPHATDRYAGPGVAWGTIADEVMFQIRSLRGVGLDEVAEKVRNAVDALTLLGAVDPFRFALHLEGVQRVSA